ncbi:MAG TPA: GNAT family N-acetyltransferase [Candidatus Acidoferrum sp.]|nr:GNAT family N-acetyltransferase [Candidatus Acidoferrum sp.]
MQLYGSPVTTSADGKRDSLHEDLSQNGLKQEDPSQDDRSQIELIQATLPEHIEQARSLFLEYGSSLGFSLCFQSFDEELKSLPGAYGPPSGRLLIARSSGHAAGCVALRKLEVGICEMKRLYVRPGDRGRGLGRILVERIIAEARAIGYERMRLDTIESAMKDAIALYRPMGFEEIAPYSVIPIEDALWMELRL